MVPAGLNRSIAGIAGESVLAGSKFDDEVGFVLEVSETVADDFSSRNPWNKLFRLKNGKEVFDIANVVMMEDLDRSEKDNNNDQQKHSHNHLSPAPQGTVDIDSFMNIL